MKNEKFLLDVQAKCGDIANEILNASVDDEQTFKCNWPKDMMDGVIGNCKYIAWHKTMS